MPRSLSARIVASFAALALALLIAIGGTVFIVLRDLHRASTESRMRYTARSGTISPFWSRRTEIGPP